MLKGVHGILKEKKKDKYMKGRPHVKFIADVPRKSFLIFLD